MKLKIFLFLGILAVLNGCGSSKKVSTNRKVVNNKTTVTKSKNTKQAKVIVQVYKPEIEENNTKIIEEKEEPQVTVKVKSYTNITQDYINQFASTAVEEMYTYKIPASITLAQGVLESGSGKSKLALKSNNHFGIKCHKGWNGHSVAHDDDAIGECFRKYEDPKKSYEDHSLFLTSRKRYAGLFKLDPTDYTGWAYGLKNAGYATDPRYPQKLISIINKYSLHEYDLKTNSSSIKVISKPEEIYSAPKKIYHIVKKGDTLYSISKRNNLSVEELKSKNNMHNNILSIGQELLVN